MIYDRLEADILLKVLLLPLSLRQGNHRMIASRYVLRRLFVLIVVIYWIKLPEFSLTLLSRSNARVAPLVDGFILSILNHNVRFTVH